jgi:hypothetical protein
MAEQTEQEQIETTVGHVVGAIYALKAGILGGVQPRPPSTSTQQKKPVL